MYKNISCINTKKNNKKNNLQVNQIRAKLFESRVISSFPSDCNSFAKLRAQWARFLTRLMFDSLETNPEISINNPLSHHS